MRYPAPHVPRALAALAIATLVLTASSGAQAAAGFRIQAPEMLPLPSGVTAISLASGDVDGDGIAEIAAFGSDRRVRVYQRVSGVWVQVAQSASGALVTNPPNASPTVRFTSEPSISAGAGYCIGQFLFNCQAPGVEIVSLRRTVGGTWSEQVLFGPLAFIASNGAFSPVVQLQAGGVAAAAWRVIVPGGDLFDPPLRAYLPKFGEVAPHATAVYNTGPGGYCEQAGSWVPDARGGDFNADGQTDVALLRSGAVWFTSSLAIPYGGNTNCWPFTKVALPSAAGHAQLAAGHFDGDATTDLIVRDGDGTLRELRGNAGAGFTFNSSVLPTSAAGTVVSTGMTTGDLDGDGDLDVVQTFQSPAGYEVLRNDGAGNFTSQFFATEPAQGLALGDYDGDGTVDLVLAQDSSTPPRLLILPGHADGTFGVPAGPSLGTLEPTVLATTDLDLDGATDVLIGGRDSNPADGLENLLVLRNSGGGALQAPLPIIGTVPDQYSGLRMLLPYKPDAGVPGEFPRLGALYHSAQLDADNVGDGTLQPLFAMYTTTLGELSGLARADFDGDGATDLARLELNPDGSTTLHVEVGPSFSDYALTGECHGLLVLDWNSDGLPDLVTTNRTPEQVEVLLQDPALPGEFLAPVPYPLGIDLISFNDHAQPLIALPGTGPARTLAVRGADRTSGGPRVQLVRNTVPNAGPIYDVSVSGPDFPVALASADVDADGIPDLVVGEDADAANESYVVVLRGQAGSPPAFTRGATFVLPGTALNDLALADLNGDGHAEMLSVSADGLIPSRPGMRPASTNAGATGHFAISPAIQHHEGVTAVDGGSAPPRVPGRLAMSIAPSPLRGDRARVSFTLPAAAHVTADLVDLAGRRIGRVIDGDLAAGTHDVGLEMRTSTGEALAPGAYFVRLRAGSESASRMFVRIR